MISNASEPAGTQPDPGNHQLHVHVASSLGWIAGGVGIIVVLFALAILWDADEHVSPKVVAAAWWMAVIPGVFLIVKGLLGLMRTLNRRQAMTLAGANFGAMIAAVVLHNVVYALWGVEEGVLFIFALFVSPAVILSALIRAARPAN